MAKSRKSRNSYIFKPTSYHLPLQLNDTQCIVPLTNTDRCGGRINLADLESALRLNQGLESREGTEKTFILTEIIRLHVCTNTHRKKLDLEKNCLARLVDLCLESLPLVSLEMTSPLVLSHPTDELSFVTCLSDRRNTVRDVLLNKIHPNQYVSGFIYGFDWPFASGYVKIGYSTKPPIDRIAEWRSCHPRANLLFSQKFEYPERMEKLIHLELADRRRCLFECSACHKSHNEWFKATAEEIQEVLQTWQSITQEHALYDKDRTLTEHWRAKAIEIEGSITSKTLLDASRMVTVLDSHSESTELNGDITESFAKLTVASKYNLRRCSQ